MKPLRFAKQVTKRYGDELSRLLGLPASQVSFSLDRGTDVAATSGTNIALNPDWFKGANRRDAAGAIVHELTHAYQDAPGSAYAAHGKSYEAIADAARARLGLGSGAGYDSGLERRYTKESDRAFRQDARQLAAGTGGFQVPNAQPGPKPGRGPGHLRNTGANANSKAGRSAYAALA
ncbi:MAG TPA: basic secretory protein-like protein, partial [Actinomycetota bacterium]|nr:basic secretory protein-like protein [Actinomycetota bacterium]